MTESPSASLLYGADAPRLGRIPEEPGRFLIDFANHEGRGDGELVAFRAEELEFLGRLIDNSDTFVPVAEACRIFEIAETPNSPGLRSAVNVVKLKLRLIADPNPLRIFVDGYGWDSEALVTVLGRT